MAGSLQIQTGVSAIRTRLQKVRRHYRSVTLAEWAALGLAMIVPVLALLFVIDNLFHLPMVARLALWVALAGGIIYLIRLAQAGVRVGSTDEEIALRVEQAFPDLNNELINSLLLPKETGEEAEHLVQAIVQSGSNDIGRVELNRAVPKRRLHILSAAAVCAVGIMAIYAAVWPDYFGNALKRILVPIAAVDPLTMTKIVNVSPGDNVVLSNSDVDISVTVEGRIPEFAEVGYKLGNNEWRVMRMSPDRNEAGRFVHRFGQVTRDSQYYVKAGDAASETFKIHVQQRPVLRDVAVQLEHPEYTGLGTVEHDRLGIRALAGSRVEISGVASKPLKYATISIKGGEPQPLNLTGENTIQTSFTLREDISFVINLVDTHGFENEPVTYDMTVMRDQAPAIDIIEPSGRVLVAEDAQLTIDFTVADDFGIRVMELVQEIVKENVEPEEVVHVTWETDEQFVKEVRHQHRLAVRDLELPAGEMGRLFIRASDWNDVTGPGIGKSRVMEIGVASREAVRRTEQEQIAQSVATLADIIQLQEHNLRETRRLERITPAEQVYRVNEEPLKPVIERQESVRKLSGELIGTLRMESPIRATLESMFVNEMVVAVRLLRNVGDETRWLSDAAKLQNEILARLVARRDTLTSSIDRQKMRDILAELEAIIAAQREIREVTQTRIEGNTWNPLPMANRQDALGDRTARYKRSVLDHAREVAQSDPAMGSKFTEIAAQFDTLRVREDMILAGAEIERDDAEGALKTQDRIIENLVAIRRMMREAVADEAEEKLRDAVAVVSSIGERLEKVIEMQRQIKEVAEELKPANDFTDEDHTELKAKLGELSEMREKLADVVEKMALDLHVFPEIPVCNEMAQKFREVYEDVEQKEGSEYKEIEEIAVQREEGGDFLDALEKLEERIADVEMWLMDEPDTTVWKVENYDTDEIPAIPLVDLAEELEDLIGDLVDQAEDLDEEANDTASNFTFGDGEMGWDTGEGTMNNFSAKGKSGNELPNTNEMYGRSGAGREGNATGEVVEDIAKDLQGRPTEARRTDDPFQQGEVAEENPDSEANATGGGKQSGAADERGFEGAGPPRNELGMRELERRAEEIRRNTERLYTQATLLYLPTGEMDNAILLMQQGQEALLKGDLAGFQALQRRTVHSMRNTLRAVRGEERVEVDPWLLLPTGMREEIFDARHEKVPPEFEGMVSEYYKAIAGALAE